MVNWKVVATAVRGTSHVETNIPCQDAFDWNVQGDIFIGVVSDGAGSAENSDIGAQLVSKTINQHFFSSIETLEKLSSVDSIKREIENAIQKTREELQSRENTTLKDYYATVVGCVVTPTTGLFFHIGDGLGAAVYDNNWAECILTLPENGEFSDQTYFYTENHWKEHLRFKEFDPQVQYIVLMTDGAMTFAAAKMLAGLEPKFMAPVSNYLEQNSTEQGIKAIHQTLNSSKSYGITSDDKTLMWAARSTSA